MPPSDRLREDLDYVARAVKHHDRPLGAPSIYFLWSAIVLAGFALPDIAPRAAGPFWLVGGIGGGLLTLWLATREARRSGVNDTRQGHRHGLHWAIGGIGFLLAALPMLLGRAEPAAVVPGFLLVAGLLYALAGVHLLRPLLWVGLMMLAAYAAMIVFAPPYAWTLTGVSIAAGMLLAGLVARRREGGPAR